MRERDVRHLSLLFPSLSIFLICHLSHSGDLLLWVGVRRHPLTSNKEMWYVAYVG